MAETEAGPEIEPPTETEAKLIADALAARERAYAPYSTFRVGAAILDETGAAHRGCNVENAAYPQGQCAEATAIGAMVVGGGTRIAIIVVVGPEDAPCPPCGGCRQRILEFSDAATLVVAASSKGVFFRRRIGELLPAGFSDRSMTARDRS